MAKNIAKTARSLRQLEGRHLLFGEYLRSWTNLNVHYRRLRACLHGGGGPQVGEVTRLGEVKK